MIAPNRMSTPETDASPTGAANAWIGGRSLEQLRDAVYMTEGLQWARYWAERADDTPLGQEDQTRLLRHAAEMLAAAGADTHVVECIETLASGLEEEAAGEGLS